MWWSVAASIRFKYIKQKSYVSSLKKIGVIFSLHKQIQRRQSQAPSTVPFDYSW